MPATNPAVSRPQRFGRLFHSLPKGTFLRSFRVVGIAVFEAAPWIHQIECQRRREAGADLTGRAAPNRGRGGPLADIATGEAQPRRLIRYRTTMMMVQWHEALEES